MCHNILSCKITIITDIDKILPTKLKFLFLFKYKK